MADYHKEERPPEPPKECTCRSYFRRTGAHAEECVCYRCWRCGTPRATCDCDRADALRRHIAMRRETDVLEHESDPPTKKTPAIETKSVFWCPKCGFSPSECDCEDSEAEPTESEPIRLPSFPSWRRETPSASPEAHLTIESDGTSPGTLVLVDGKPLARVRSVTWRVSYGEMAVVELELVGIPVTVNATMPPEVCFECAACGDFSPTHVCTKS